MRLLGNRMLVRRVEHEKENKSGIIIPDSVQNTTFIGEVVKVGPGIMTDSGALIHPLISKGDHIIYASTVGFHVTVDENEFTILNEIDVIAIIQDDKIQSLIRNRILIEKDAVEEMSGGIILTKAQDSEISYGKVINVGIGMVTAKGEILPMPVKAGDAIMYLSARGFEFKLGSNSFFVLDARDVVALVED